MRTRPPATLTTTAIRTAVLAALLPVLTPAAALSTSWVGGAAGAPTSWANKLNWQPQQVPLSAADTVLLFPNSFVAAVNDIVENFQFNQISAFAGNSGAPTGSLTGKALVPVGTGAQIAVGAGGVLTVGNPLAGSGAWSKTGSGDLVLTGNNVAASGGITIAAGRLNATATGTLGSGAITMAGGATLRSGGTQTFAGIAGAGNWQAEGVVTLAPTPGERRFDGSVTGDATLNKSGVGRQLFTGAVQLAGPVTVGAGELALSGPAANWSGSTEVTVGGAGTAALSNGARWTTAGDLNVSGAGGATSMLSLSGGSSFTAGTLFVGRNAGQRGQVFLDNSSELNTTGPLNLGSLGAGSLTLDRGSQATANGLNLGGGAGASGQVTLSRGSGLRVNNITLLGSDGGQGSVTVNAGSSASVLDILIGYGGPGSITLDGMGSSWTAVLMFIGTFSSGTLAVSQGVVKSGNVQVGFDTSGVGRATLSSGAQWTAGDLTVGFLGRGSVALSGGSTLTSAAGDLGVIPDSSGEVTLDSGASWTVSGATSIGQSGKGSLGLSGGATFTSGSVVLGYNAGGSGAATLGGGSAADLWVNSGPLVIGRAGSGAVTLLDRATLTVAGDTFIGQATGGSGSLVLNGTTSNLPTMGIAGSLVVGDAGSGSLQVLGGTVRAASASVGRAVGGTGSVTVQRATPGVAARISVDGDLTVGSSAAGRTSGLLTVGTGGEVLVGGALAIQPGGQVTLGDGRLQVVSLGPNSGGRLNWTGGTLAITGGGVTLGSTPYLGRVLGLSGNQALEVPQLSVGTATLVLADQAQVRAASLSLAGGQIVGDATQTLPGTALSGYGLVGTPVNGGSGSAVLATGGTLIAGDVNRPNGFANSGTTTVDSGARLVLASAGEIGLPAALLLGGSTLQTFNGLRLAEAGKLQAPAGATVLGPFTNAGTVEGPQLPGQFLVFDDDVAGAGLFTGNVRFRQLYTPGHGAQLQNLNLATTATLVLDALGAQARGASPLRVDGLAALDGTLDLQFAPGYAPAGVGASFVLMDWGSRIGSFASLQVEGLASGWQVDLHYDPDALRVAISAVPEPATWLSMLLGSTLLVAGRRPRRPLARACTVSADGP